MVRKTKTVVQLMFVRIKMSFLKNKTNTFDKYFIFIALLWFYYSLILSLSQYQSIGFLQLSEAIDILIMIGQGHVYLLIDVITFTSNRCTVNVRVTLR